VAVVVIPSFTTALEVYFLLATLYLYIYILCDGGINATVQSTTFKDHPLLQVRIELVKFYASIHGHFI
jgi:hypothetical protein